MACQVCGRGIEAGQLFCPACGTRVAQVPPPMGTPGYVSGPYPVRGAYGQVPVRSRVERNLQPLGVLWCVFGGIRLLQGALGLVAVRFFTGGGMDGTFWPYSFGAHPLMPPWMHALLPFIAVGAVVTSGLAFLTGYALLTRRTWGRTLALIVAVLSLFKIPFGTALGVYTLMILAPAGAALEYEAVADRRV